MPMIDLGEMPAQEPVPGWRGRFFSSERMTFVYYDIAAGGATPVHAHEQEEVWHVLDGELEVVVEGVRSVAHAGCVVVVPAESEHVARAVTDCRVIVVDAPRRDTFRDVEIARV
jgi:quercetin dioxygenase-like cupin family protein